MEVSAKLRTCLRDKHLLLDTCFIIKTHEYLGTDFFWDLFYFFEKNNCTTVINEFIEFEFMCGARRTKHIALKQKFFTSSHLS